jgi:HSF-type DNA-binding
MLHVDKSYETLSARGAPLPIDWCTRNSGEASDHVIVVNDCGRLVKEILPEFGFLSISWESFVRKMYRWGFRQASEVFGRPCKNAPPMFQSKYFRKDNLAILSHMQSKTAEKEQRSDASRYSMSQHKGVSELERNEGAMTSLPLESMSNLSAERRHPDHEFGSLQRRSLTDPAGGIESLIVHPVTHPLLWQRHIRRQQSAIPGECNSQRSRLQYLNRSLQPRTLARFPQASRHLPLCHQLQRPQVPRAVYPQTTNVFRGTTLLANPISQTQTRPMGFSRIAARPLMLPLNQYASTRNIIYAGVPRDPQRPIGRRAPDMFLSTDPNHMSRNIGNSGLAVDPLVFQEPAHARSGQSAVHPPTPGSSTAPRMLGQPSPAVVLGLRGAFEETNEQYQRRLLVELQRIEHEIHEMHSLYSTQSWPFSPP